MGLKFEDVANIGDKIKAYDFQPRRARENRFVVGTVIDKGFDDHMHAYIYKVRVEEDTLFPENPRSVVGVPFEILFDYDHRVQKV